MVLMLKLIIAVLALLTAVGLPTTIARSLCVRRKADFVSFAYGKSTIANSAFHRVIAAADARVTSSARVAIRAEVGGGGSSIPSDAAAARMQCDCISMGRGR